MKKIWVLIGSFILGAPVGTFADSVKQAAPPKLEESTPEQDKAALEAASSDADKWAASHKEKPAAPKPAEAATPSAPPPPAAVKASAPAPAAAAKTPDQPVAPPHRTGLNEMKGKLLSVGSDPRSLRLIVDGGYNVEFSFDTKTSVVNGGDPIKIDDLGYNDVLVVRYSGKELYAIEIERISKAPRPE